MKFDYYVIKYLEEQNDAVCLSTLRKKQQYLYVKIRKHYPEKIFNIPIKQQNGNEYNLRFVKIMDLENLKKSKYVRCGKANER